MPCCSRLRLRMFDPVDPKQSLPDLEVGILQYWREEDTFKRSIRKHQANTGDVLDNPEKANNRQPTTEFSFYDGPPFATGLPHYGHLLAGTIKDVIPRYQTMRGKAVQRRFGWDCHGLPIENIIEKEHDIKDKQQIEEMGDIVGLKVKRTGQESPVQIVAAFHDKIIFTLFLNQMEKYYMDARHHAERIRLAKTHHERERDL